MATTAVISVFAKVYALPGAKPQLTVSNRDIEAIAEDAGLQMRGHVIRAFVLMTIIRFVFWNRMVEVALKILAYARIRILIDGQ